MEQKHGTLPVKKTELSVSATNNHLKYQEKRDHLYHIGLTSEDDLKKRFGDVKFVCIGGKQSRMRAFAKYMYDLLNQPKNCEFDNTADINDNSLGRLKDISEPAGRYAMFKVGPVIFASHGIGIPSTSVLLHEIIKLLQYAGCTDVTLFRVGTSGGLGLIPGTVVVTDRAYNGLLKPDFSQISCGKTVTYPTNVDDDFTKKICDCAKAVKIKAVVGSTLSCNDFYEEQARLDGAFCNYTSEEKMAFLERAHKKGILNIEMEATCIISMCKRAGIKCGVVCVAIVNRLEGDSVTEDISQLKEWEKYPPRIIGEYILQHDSSKTNNSKQQLTSKK